MIPYREYDYEEILVAKEFMERDTKRKRSRNQVFFVESGYAGGRGGASIEPSTARLPIDV